MGRRTSASPTSNQVEKPSLVFIGDSIVYGFIKYENKWDNHFRKQIVNCRIKGDRTENLIFKIQDLIFQQHIKQILIICGTNNPDFDRASNIANALICAAILIRLAPIE